MIKKTHSESKTITDNELESKDKLIKILENDLKVAQEKYSKMEKELKEREFNYKISESKSEDEKTTLNKKNF